MKTGMAFVDKFLNFKYNFAPLLQNKFVLYFICFLAIVDIVYLANVNDIRSIIILVLVGLLTSFFNKNMIVIIVFAICIAHILKYGTGNTYEGMANDNDESADDSTKDDMNNDDSSNDDSANDDSTNDDSKKDDSPKKKNK